MRSRAGADVWCLLLVLLLGSSCAAVYKQTYASFTTPTPLRPGDHLVLGFLGGLEAWNSADQGVRTLALHLRSQNISGLHIETVEDRKRALAIELVRRAFDFDGDGVLGEEERRSVRLILYGMSFGGAAVVRLARDLEAMGVPVLLTVQIDSVGGDDDLIPANVAAAANIYQKEYGALVHGESKIRGADPSKTTILGNFRFSYSDRTVDLSAIPWYKIIFRRAHAKVNADPDVWATVSDLILSVVSRPRTAAD
jgi:hypothetical protein